MRRLFAIASILGILVLAACTPTARSAGPTPLAAAQGSTTPTPPAAAPPTVLTTRPAATPNASPTASGPWITLSPDAGPPGTVVRIDGFLPGGPSVVNAHTDGILGHANLCWGTCPDGLSEEAVPVTWSDAQPGRFTMQLTVPSTSWLAADGPHSPVPGDYSVGVQCLAPTIPTKKGPDFKPCRIQEAQASATFHLLGPTPPQSGLVAQLRFTPMSGPPGTLVQVRGWAPLNQIVGGQPFPYSLTLQKGGSATGYTPQLGQLHQDIDGDLSGSFRVPMSAPPLGLLAPDSYTIAIEAIHTVSQPATPPTAAGVAIRPLNKGAGAERITLAPTAFRITAAPSWASLGTVHPLWVQRSTQLYGAPAVVGDPADPQRLAYCTDRGIRVSSDSGKVWSTIPTAGAIQALATTPFQFFQAGNLATACADVVLDPTHPHSYYATFGVVKKGQSAPPEYLIGLVTTDDGQSWQVVPTPEGYALDQFGGFQVNGQVVEVLFGGRTTSQGPRPFAGETTTDGGQTWTEGRLTCPSSGPCIRWGPAPSSIGGMGVGYPQPIEISTDGGQTWTPPDWPSQVTLNQGPSNLVALSPTEVALVAPGSQYPLRVSNDGGRTWEVIALPSLPGTSKDSYPAFPGLTLLSDGRLLAASDRQWQILLPGSTAWCSVEGASLPLPAGPSATFRVIGDKLWWQQSSNAPGGSPPVPRSVPLSELRCGATTR